MAVMESQIAWPEPRPALVASQCSVDSCREAVAAELRTRLDVPRSFSFLVRL